MFSFFYKSISITWTLDKARFFGVVLRLGRWKCHILHLKTGTFAKSARFQVPKDGTLSTQIKERTPNGPLTEAFYENQNQGKKVLKTWTPH